MSGCQPQYLDNRDLQFYDAIIDFCTNPRPTSRREDTIMSLTNWIFVIFGALIAAIAAAIIGKVIGLMQPKRQVTYEVTSSICVLFKEVKRQIRATFYGRPISNAQLISLRVKNTGKETIEKGDYEPGTQIRFSFGNDAKAVAVDQTNAPGTSVTIDAGSVSLVPLRLESQESVTLDILVTDFKDEIIVETPQFRPPGSRTAGSKAGIKVPLSGESPLPRNILLTFIVLVVVALLLFSFISAFIYENVFNENFSVSLSNIFYLSEYVASFIAAIMISITYIVSNYFFSPLEVGTEHPEIGKTILKMDELRQRFHYVWTIFTFLIISPLIYLLVVYALETSINTYIYTVGYPNSYVSAFIYSALWSGFVITAIISIITYFANEYLHKRFPLKMPAITPKLSKNFRSPLAVERSAFPLEIPQVSGIPSLNVRLERIDFYQPDDQSMKWTFTLMNNTARDVHMLSVQNLELENTELENTELENTARGGFYKGQTSGLGDIAAGQSRQITASFPLPLLNQPYTLHLILACDTSQITYVDLNFTFGVTYQPHLPYF